MRIKNRQAGAFEITEAMIATAAQVLEDSFDAAPLHARATAKLLLVSLGGKCAERVVDHKHLSA